MTANRRSVRILIIEDNADIAHLVRVNLMGSGYRLVHAADGENGLHQALEGGYDLIILDLMLPGIDGLEVCRRLRANDCFTPILMLTAKSSELERVLGLEMGADDYLSKPFSVPEMVARVKAILRRSEDYSNASHQEPIGALHFGSLSINAETRQVDIDDSPVELTAKEFDLLWHFAVHPGRVFTRSQLLDCIWGYGHQGYEHTVNSHINRLRSKIESNPNNPRYILTVWGVGYKLAADEVA